MMKKTIKALVTTLAAAACVVLFAGNGMTAKAAGDTFAVKFVGGDVNEWRYQVGQAFDDTAANISINGLITGMKEGDHVVVYPATGVDTVPLDLTAAKKLGSLTIYQGTKAVVNVAGADYAYVLSGSTSAIYGNVKSAWVYDKAVCSFANDVTDLVLYSSGSKASNISVSGTVGRFCSYSLSDNKKEYELYDIAAGAFTMTNGAHNTPADKYKAEPSAAYIAAMNTLAKNDASSSYVTGGSAPAATTTTSTPATTTTSTDSGEYDKVPKTGDSHVALYLGMISVFCMAGAAALRKKEN